MARKLSVASGRATLRALQKAGFVLRHVRGSHHVLMNPGPPVRMVSVPVHGNREIPIGTLSAILDQAGLSVEEFAALL
jgi:predicted RNA binding protein YcfA (HicA-like mRNA interferase family)